MVRSLFCDANTGSNDPSAHDCSSISYKSVKRARASGSSFALWDGAVHMSTDRSDVCTFGSYRARRTAGFLETCSALPLSMPAHARNASKGHGAAFLGDMSSGKGALSARVDGTRSHQVSNLCCKGGWSKRANQLAFTALPQHANGTPPFVGAAGGGYPGTAVGVPGTPTTGGTGQVSAPSVAPTGVAYLGGAQPGVPQMGAQPGVAYPGVQQPGFAPPGGMQPPGFRPGYPGGVHNSIHGGYADGYDGNPYGQPQPNASQIPESMEGKHIEPEHGRANELEEGVKGGGRGGRNARLLTGLLAPPACMIAAGAGYYYFLKPHPVKTRLGGDDLEYIADSDLDARSRSSDGAPAGTYTASGAAPPAYIPPAGGFSWMDGGGAADETPDDRF